MQAHNFLKKHSPIHTQLLYAAKGLESFEADLEKLISWQGQVVSFPNCAIYWNSYEGGKDYITIIADDDVVTRKCHSQREDALGRLLWYAAWDKPFVLNPELPVEFLASEDPANKLFTPTLQNGHFLVHERSLIGADEQGPFLIGAKCGRPKGLSVSQYLDLLPVTTEIIPRATLSFSC
jgi:hypothetical protein